MDGETYSYTCECFFDENDPATLIFTECLPDIYSIGCGPFQTGENPSTVLFDYLDTINV